MRLEHEYVAQKLNGEVAEFMPVAKPTKFELVINLKTAKVPGLTIPPIVLLLAEKMIKREGASVDRQVDKGREKHEQKNRHRCS